MENFFIKEKQPSSSKQHVPQSSRQEEAVPQSCFNCWTPECPLETCKHPRRLARIKRNLGDWKMLRKFNNIHYVNIKEEEASEVFMASSALADLEHNEPSPALQAPATAEQEHNVPFAIYFVLEQELVSNNDNEDANNRENEFPFTTTCEYNEENVGEDETLSVAASENEMLFKATHTPPSQSPYQR